MTLLYKLLLSYCMLTVLLTLPHWREVQEELKAALRYTSYGTTVAAIIYLLPNSGLQDESNHVLLLLIGVLACSIFLYLISPKLESIFGFNREK